MTCQRSTACETFTFEGEKIVRAEVYFGWNLD
jgi:hypothetical protein